MSRWEEAVISDVLEELTGTLLDRNQVEKRVKDWDHRINALYRQIASWLPASWIATKDQRLAIMHEEPMREADFPPYDLPVLHLTKGDTSVASIAPRGLWIVGANGRLDLMRGTDQYVIVDTAEIFNAPDWKIASVANRGQQRPFDKAALRSVLL